MPISSESAAASVARREAESWAGLADLWDRGAVTSGVADRPLTEAAIVPEFDPAEDLSRRASRWGHRLPDAGFVAIARFAAGLAAAEADGWDRTDHVVATRALEDRRFLLADRIMPWAVPWFDAASRCFPELREPSVHTRTVLLELGEHHRPAPVLAAREGLTIPGHDGFGPLDAPAEPAARLRSLWGGAIVFTRTLRSLLGAADLDWDAAVMRALDTKRADLVTMYGVAVARWRRMAAEYPGTAAYWLDLAQRAAHTGRLLGPR
jgi:hypothetical protein